MSRPARLAIACLLFFALATASACSGEPQAEQPSPSAQPPTSGDSGGDGQALVESKCTRCHSLDRVNEAKKSKNEWAATVERMESNGLQASEDEKSQIVDYLAERDAQR